MYKCITFRLRGFTFCASMLFRWLFISPTRVSGKNKKERDKFNHKFYKYSFITISKLRFHRNFYINPSILPFSPVSWSSLRGPVLVLFQLLLESFLFFLQPPLLHLSLLGGCVHRFGSPKYRGSPAVISSVTLRRQASTPFLLFWDAPWLQV